MRRSKCQGGTIKARQEEKIQMSYNAHWVAQTSTSKEETRVARRGQ
jgi:hypothetical protein